MTFDPFPKVQVIREYIVKKIKNRTFPCYPGASITSEKCVCARGGIFTNYISVKGFSGGGGGEQSGWSVVVSVYLY